jgi:hypothetical protein
MMTRIFIALTGLLMSTAIAGAASLDITVENTQSSGGFFFTPFWVAAHNGGFDSYDEGALSALSPAIIPLAEVGDTGPISDAFAGSMAGAAGGVDTTIAAVAGMGDAPVFSPGESTTVSLDIGDASVNRYFSFASMVIPSNDLFVGNDDALAHELFDAGGNFLGPVVIELYGADVNDNGTERNSSANDAAFSTLDGQALPETHVVRSLFTSANDATYLSSFVGTSTPTGDIIGTTFDSGTLLGRIVITPEPGSLSLLSLAGLLLIRRK